MGPKRRMKRKQPINVTRVKKTQENNAWAPILNVPPITKNETEKKIRRKNGKRHKTNRARKTQAGPHGSNGRI